MNGPVRHLTACHRVEDVGAPDAFSIKYKIPPLHVKTPYHDHEESPDDEYADGPDNEFYDQKCHGAVTLSWAAPIWHILYIDTIPLISTDRCKTQSVSAGEAGGVRAEIKGPEAPTR